MKAETQLTTKGQVVIPKAVRDRMKWRAGLRLQVQATEDGAVLLRPDSDETAGIDTLIEQVSGFIHDIQGDPLSDLEADHRAEIEADERWLRSRR
ncbi:MAG: AbrB/MazE/SpoVT family DNA-binding domain-containing protein [Myxococcota bacterium]